MSKTKPVSYLLQGKNIILVIDGKSHTISKSTHISYGKIVDALKDKDWDALRDLVEPKKAIVNFGKGHVSINDGKVYWKGALFPNSLSSRMIEMYQDGFPIDPMVRFMENMMQNPSKRSVEQVYGFLEKNNLPITEDGFFLAFKKVRDDYMDIHSGTISNAIGTVVEMDRNLVDDNPDSHCSTGLHFCSESYLPSFGNGNQPVMILKINPADVVSIPTDYNGAKGRCCKYEVVAQVSGDPKTAFASVVNGDYSPKPAPVKASKPAPATQWPFVATPAAAWPFPKTMPAPTKVSSGGTWPSKSNTSATGSYNLVRARSGDVEFTGLSLAEARTIRDKRIAQKKATLKIVDANTGADVQ